PVRGQAAPGALLVVHEEGDAGRFVAGVALLAVEQRRRLLRDVHVDAALFDHLVAGGRRLDECERQARRRAVQGRVIHVEPQPARVGQLRVVHELPDGVSRLGCERDHRVLLRLGTRSLPTVHPAKRQPVADTSSGGILLARRRTIHSTASVGWGRPRNYPCTESQPSSVRRARASSVSTPSATTWRPRLWPRSIVERTITASSLSSVMFITKERSIFKTSIGRRLREQSVEWALAEAVTAER